MRSSHPCLALTLTLLALALGGAASQEAPSPYAERFAQLDQDHDGTVEREEWPLAAESFDVVDRDQNGRLSPSELLTPNTFPPGRPERHPAPQEARPPDLPGATIPRDPIALLLNTWRLDSTPQAQSRFRSQDRDQDHRINRLEWVGIPALFERLDHNRDGVLTPNEWPR